MPNSLVVAELVAKKVHVMNAVEIFTVAEGFNMANSQEAIYSLVLEITSPLGVDFAFSGIIPPTGLSAEEQQSHILFGQWPHEWAQRYFDRGYLDHDPTINHVRTSDNSLGWSDMGSHNSTIMNEAREFKLIDGYTAPLISVDGKRLGMSFAGECISKRPDVASIFSLTGALACARSLDLHVQMQKRPHLTRTEMRCLRWIVEGKSNWDISTILGNSEKTVEAHVSNMLRKFGAVNRTQIAAHAIRLGLFQ